MYCYKVAWKESVMVSLQRPSLHQMEVANRMLEACDRGLQVCDGCLVAVHDKLQLLTCRMALAQAIGLVGSASTWVRSLVVHTCVLQRLTGTEHSMPCVFNCARNALLLFCSKLSSLIAAGARLCR